MNLDSLGGWRPLSGKPEYPLKWISSYQDEILSAEVILYENGAGNQLREIKRGNVSAWELLMPEENASDA